GTQRQSRDCAACSSGSCSGLLRGRGDCSSIPRTPSRKKRSFHLYPVFALIPYSWHSARKFSVRTALKANSILCSIGSVLLHGIERHFLALSAKTVLPMS